MRGDEVGVEPRSGAAGERGEPEVPLAPRSRCGPPGGRLVSRRASTAPGAVDTWRGGRGGVRRWSRPLAPHPREERPQSRGGNQIWGGVCPPQPDYVGPLEIVTEKVSEGDSDVLRKDNVKSLLNINRKSESQERIFWIY